MNDIEFDRILKEKLNELHWEPNKAQWEQLCYKLNTLKGDEGFDHQLLSSLQNNILIGQTPDWEHLSNQLDTHIGNAQFDAALHQHFTSNPAPIKGWEQVASQLLTNSIYNKAFSKKWMWRSVSLAAACLLIIFTGLLMMNHQVVRQSTHSSSNHNTANASLPTKNNPATFTTKSISPQVPQVKNEVSIASPKRTFKKATITSTPVVLEKYTHSPEVASSVKTLASNDNNNQSSISISKNTDTKHYKVNNAKPTSPTKATYYPNENIALPPNVHTNDLNTSIAFNGGANYGTMKAGTALGLSVKHYVNDHIFIEGNLGMVYNSGSDNTLNYTGNANSTIFNSNNGGLASRDAGMYYVVNNFYYIQFNPLVGTTLTKHITVSTGPDFQEMLKTGNDATIMFKDDGRKQLVPIFDVGLTGKAEISITPHIHTGIIYRQGINNIIRNNNDYLNRNYIQLQLKYALPIK